jgi:hypothetical protein
MKSFLINAGIAGALALGLFATPSQASTVLSFFNTGTTCVPASSTCGTAAGSGGNLNTLSILDFTGFTETVGVAPVETWALAAGASLSYSGGTTYTFAGTASCSTGACAGKNTGNITLFTFQAPDISYSGTTGPFSLVLGAATSLTESATFLSDLGLTVPAGAPTINLTAATTNASTPGAMNLTASQTFTITTNQAFTTPEPVSTVLFGTGLFAVAVIARRKTRQTVSVPAA